MFLLKPVFQIRNALFKFQHARYKFKTVQFLLKTRILKVIVQNQLPIKFSTVQVCNKILEVKNTLI